MAYENLLFEKRDLIGIVSLNRPEYLNGLAPGVVEDLQRVFLEMDADPEVRVAVLTGAGRAFCAGAFIRDPKTHYADHPSGNVMRSDGGSGEALDRFKKPVIAAVNGPAYGAGLNLVIKSDLAIASTAARFCFPMTRLGFIPGQVGGPRLALSIGKMKAAEIAVMARVFDAQEAYRSGLVNKVVAPEDLMEEAMEWAAEITALAPLATILAKEDLREGLNHHVDVETNRLRVMAAQLTDDCKEGHQAWREKRSPVFTGR